MSLGTAVVNAIFAPRTNGEHVWWHMQVANIRRCKPSLDTGGTAHTLSDSTTYISE